MGTTMGSAVKTRRGRAAVRDTGTPCLRHGMPGETTEGHCPIHEDGKAPAARAQADDESAPSTKLSPEPEDLPSCAGAGKTVCLCRVSVPSSRYFRTAGNFNPYCFTTACGLRNMKLCCPGSVSARSHSVAGDREAGAFCSATRLGRWSCYVHVAAQFLCASGFPRFRHQ